MSKTSRALSADHNKQIVMCEADETTCGVCYAEFLDVEDLKLHIEQIHPSGNLISCQFCDQKLTDAENYALHMRDIHLLDFKACWACTRVFTDSSQFRKHEIKHPRSMREGTFTCSQCDEFVLNKYDLRQHEKDKHNTSEGAFLDKYYALLTSVINMKAETLIQSSGKDLVFTCCACTLSTMDLELYVAHLKKNNCRSYVCDWCSGLCRRKPDLVYHIKQHMKGKADDQIIPSKINMKQCFKCKEHYHRSVSNHRCSNLKCSQCDMVFKTMYELSEHQPKVHPISVALSVCKFCRKECIGGDSLNKHMQRAHNHELHLYKYTCSYCDTTFKHPQRLFAHYFLKHKDISPYLCKICDKSFRIRKSFTLHIKLQHQSEGYVEFDEKLHVFFTEKKSDKPFQPVSKYASEIPVEAGPSNKGKTTEENKAKKSKDLKVANIDSDVDPTDNESKETNTKKTRKRKKDDINEVMVLSEDDSDDEPLVVVKKKAKLKSMLKKRPLLWKGKPTKKISKNQLTCKICKKYCYTFQNYQNHVNLHFRDEAKKCIKCSLLFKSKDDLQKHMTDQHSSSQLTETLKNIIERRKKGDHKQEMSTTMKFLKTIKKVQIEKDEVTATLNPITKEMSVQKFIENFTPEGGPAKTIDIKHSITMMKVTQPIEKEPLIKMTKFKPPAPINEGTIKLAMPVKFRRCNEQYSVSVKRVQTDVVQSKLNFTYDDGNQFQDDYNDNDDNDYSYQEEAKESIIPEVEQEVTLGTDEGPKKASATHKIVIPKLPKELKSIRIAHLLPEAPYYKIVKVADIIKSHEEKSQPPKPELVEDEPVSTDIRLPDGTKLVHVNPLAHLLGNTSVEKIVKTQNKYYKAKPKNFEAVLAKALRKLEEAPKKQKKKIVKTENKRATDKEVADVDLSDADAEKETVVNDETPTEFTEEAIEELTENV